MTTTPLAAAGIVIPPQPSFFDRTRDARREVRPNRSESGNWRSEQASAKLRRSENTIRSMERMLRARGGRYVSSVSYRYVVGPDGKRYIVGADVSVSAPEEVMKDLGLYPGSVPDRLVAKRAERSYEDLQDAHKAETSRKEGQDRVVHRLEARDREVKTHEAAHQRAGAPFTGMATYDYVKGPDGRQYAVAGRVPIAVPTGSTPEETIQMMNRVKASALAPNAPSGKDISVAAEAESKAARARQELVQRQATRAYSGVPSFREGTLLSLAA